MKIKFTPDQYYEKDVLVSQIHKKEGDGGIDGRAHTSGTDPQEVKELVAQGSLTLLPRLTEDYVIEDGRHGVDALIELGTDKTTHAAPKTIRVLVHRGVYFNRLTADEKAQVGAFANLANLGETFRRFGTYGDIQNRFEKNIRDAQWGLPQFLEVYAPRLSKYRIEKIFAAATNVVQVSQIALARNYLKKHPTQSPVQVAKKFEIPATKVSSIIQRGGSATPSKRSFKAMKDRQDALDAAVQAVKRYADSNLEAVRKGEMTAKMAVDLADYQIRTAHRLLEKAQDARDNTSKIIDSEVPGNHRF
jgi:hypothetical protein